jgi:hypothetical protein
MCYSLVLSFSEFQIRIVAVHVRPDPKLIVQECCLKVTLLPLRLNIDQDSLLFLFNFFTDISGLNKCKGVYCDQNCTKICVEYNYIYTGTSKWPDSCFSRSSPHSLDAREGVPESQSGWYSKD